MLPLSTIQQSLKQARSASQDLRALLTASSPPSAEDVRTCMERGAQPQWMSKQGTECAQDAVTLALGKGYPDAVEVILEMSEKLPTPKNSSLYRVAMGERKFRSKEDINDFRRSVAALVKHGYSFEKQETVYWPALADAFVDGKLDYAKVLLEAGVASAFNDKEFAIRVLTRVFAVTGGVDLLVEYAHPKDHPELASHWWGVMCSEARNMRSELPRAVEIGLVVDPPSPYREAWIFKKAPTVMVEMLRQGFVPIGQQKLESWEPAGLLEPLWRLNAENVGVFLNADIPVHSLNLQLQESVNGYNWLSHLVVNEHWVDVNRWRKISDRIDLINEVLGRAILAGLDVHGRDNEGKTAGWHILSALVRHSQFRPSAGEDNPGSSENTKEWLNIVANFELAAAPVLEDGREVSLLEAVNGIPASLFRNAGLLEKVEASIQNFQLNKTSQKTLKSSQPRRF